jgi:hypothetical protein
MTTENSSTDDDTSGTHGSDTPKSPMIPKARLDEEIGKRRALETEYADLADSLLADIPDRLKALVPAELSPAAKIKWFREAKKTGVFDAKVDVPETDTGKPRTTPQDQNVSTLPAHARIAAGYGKAS